MLDASVLARRPPRGGQQAAGAPPTHVCSHLSQDDGARPVVSFHTRQAHGVADEACRGRGEQGRAVAAGDASVACVRHNTPVTCAATCALHCSCEAEHRARLSQPSTHLWVQSQRRAAGGLPGPAPLPPTLGRRSGRVLPAGRQGCCRAGGAAEGGGGACENRQPEGPGALPARSRATAAPACVSLPALHRPPAHPPCWHPRTTPLSLPATHRITVSKKLIVLCCSKSSFCTTQSRPLHSTHSATRQ